MQQRGRKSAASLSVVVADEDGQTERVPRTIQPPSTLSDAERQVWLSLVESKAANYFGTEHVPLLVQYVRAVCSAEVVNQQLQAFDPEWFDTDEGLRRYDRLQGMAHRLANTIHILARSMRITHHAVLRAHKASLGTGKGRKPWQRDD